jgi:hypothetical protein
MRGSKSITLLACVLVFGSAAAFAGINSKEVGALLVYPEYWATSTLEDATATNIQTYVTVTNDKSTPVNAHVEVIGGEFCGDCNMDLPLTGFQTKLLILRRQLITGGYRTVVLDTADDVYLTACLEKHGFVVVTLEAPGVEPRRTLGENMLHGDEVVVDLTTGAAFQVGAISVQGVGPNDGDRNYRFDNLEYAAFPSIVTANFWTPSSTVDPHLILFNVDFKTGIAPTTNCSINYVDNQENMKSASYNFGCWTDTKLTDLAAGFGVLPYPNGFLWAQCDAGTHGAIMTNLIDGRWVNTFKDTLFQSVTSTASAVLHLTPSTTSTP